MRLCFTAPTFLSVLTARARVLGQTLLAYQHKHQLFWVEVLGFFRSSWALLPLRYQSILCRAPLSFCRLWPCRQAPMQFAPPVIMQAAYLAGSCFPGLGSTGQFSEFIRKRDFLPMAHVSSLFPFSIQPFIFLPVCAPFFSEIIYHCSILPDFNILLRSA